MRFSCGRELELIYTYAICRKDMPLMSFAFDALSSKNTTVCRTDPVAVLRLKISVISRRATSDLPFTVHVYSLPAIPSSSESWGSADVLRVS